MSEDAKKVAFTSSSETVNEVLPMGLEKVLNCKQDTDDRINGIFDENDPQIKHDIVQMILQYLSANGLSTSAVVLQEESGLVSRDHSNRIPVVKELRTRVMNGEWEMVESIVKEQFDEERQKPLLYQIYRQVYLEFISRSEFQKALQYLFKVLKPLETVSNSFGQQEFMELCYLLTEKSVQSSSYFRHWPAIPKAREILADKLSREFVGETVIVEKPIPANRLVHLLKQAFVFQTQKPRCTEVFPPMSSLLEDYNQYALPSVLHSFPEHIRGPVRNCSVIHSSLYAIASHSAVYLWDGMNTLNKLSDCGSTVWDLDVSCDGQLLMAGSADGIIRIWRTSSFSEPLTLTTNQNDLYSIAAHPVVPQFILSGGFNGTVELWNSETSRILKQYSPHSSSVSALTVNPAGNLAISGGKDQRIAVWDLVNLCEVTVVEDGLKEITGLACSSCGNLVAVADRSNCHHLVDLRTNCVEMAFRGVMNTRSNFLRIHFLNDVFIYSGNEMGSVCIWDIRNQKMISSLKSPRGSGAILDCAYFRENGKMVAGTSDGSLCQWTCP
ncbi:hypothetical protein WA171_001141 [Blastocystis sp. BT1]